MRKCRFLIIDPDGKLIFKKGKFHQWGYTVYGYENYGIMRTVAIVEDEEGQVYVTSPTDIQFIDESL